MAPELSETEARRQALVLRGAWGMVLVPAVNGAAPAAPRVRLHEEDN